MDEQKNQWEHFDVISTYTDEQSVDDGILVPLDKANRVTRPVWAFLHQSTPMGAKPPNRWPVNMMGWFRAGEIKQQDALKLIIKHGTIAQSKYEQEIRDKKAAALAGGIIGTYGTRARKVYDENIGGGIFKLYAILDKTQTLCGLSEQETGKVLWLVPNENGGITLMFPEDY